MKQILFVVVLSLVYVLSMVGQEFIFTLSGKDGDGRGQGLRFGVNASATFCEDTLLGERNNYLPPPFPYNFTWANPRTNGPCDGDDCFSCGRVRSDDGKAPLDLRPFLSEAQVDTYRISMYSFLTQIRSWPFHIEWNTVNFSQHCDSMKLQYTGNTSGFVVVDMFQNSSHSITDGSVQSCYIIKWGAKNLSLPPAPLSVTPSSIDFGYVEVGDSVSFQVTVTNESDSTVNIDTVFSTHSVFSFTGELTDSGISPGASRIISIRFTPTTPTPRTGEIMIYPSTLYAPLSIPVHGNGGSLPTTALLFHPDSAGFGYVEPGYQSDIPIFIYSQTSNPVWIDTMYSTHPDFSIIGDLSNTNIPPVESRMFQVRFTPSDFGLRSGNVVINYVGQSRNDTIPCTGVGGEPPPTTLVFEPDSVVFGFVPLGEFASRIISATNNGSTNAYVTALYTDGSDFGFSSELMDSGISPGATRNFSLYFTPSGLGARTGNIYIEQQDHAFTFIPVQGTGGDSLQHFSLSKDSLDFSETNIGTPKLKSVTVTNTGNLNLLITSVISSNPSFLVSPTSTTLGAGTTKYFYIIYTPTRRGDDSSNIVFIHNGESSPDTLLVHGKGVINNITVSVQQRWNIISHPMFVPNDSVKKIYPGSIYDYAFSFSEASGYLQQSVLEHGIGYWEKFPNNQHVTISGTPILTDSVDVTAGWNLIGSLSERILSSSIEPLSTSIQSPLYEFVNGYKITDTIKPGKGYWLNVSSDGLLILSAESFMRKREVKEVTALQDVMSNSLFITDATGNSQQLYFDDEIPSGFDVNYFRLPPLPPDESFDVRFSSGRIFEILGEQTGKHSRILLSGVHFPLAVTWNMKKEMSVSLAIDGKRIPLTMSGTMNIENPSLIALVPGEPRTPTVSFHLEQNFPNPFNPVTRISYSIGTPGVVTLKVFDVLGQEVQTLVNAFQNSGTHEVEFDGSSLSSGLYSYRLVTEKYTKTKRMLLLR